MIVLFGVSGIVIQPLTILFGSIVTNDRLSFFGNNKIDKLRRVRLSGCGPFGLEEGMIGINQKRVSAKSNGQIVDLLFMGTGIGAPGIEGCFRLSDVGLRAAVLAAARQLQMSYRAVWIRIRKSEERIGKPLVVPTGKDSKLTPFAERLVKQINRLQTIIESESDDVYNDLMSDQFP